MLSAEVQYAPGLVGYVHRQLGLNRSPRQRVGEDHDRFRRRGAAVRQDGGHSVGRFRQGPTEDDVMHEHLATFSADEGVVFHPAGRRRRPRCSARRNDATTTAVTLSLDRENPPVCDQPILFLLCWTAIRSVLHQVSAPISRTTAKLCLNRESLGAAPGGESGYRFRAHGQRVRCGGRPGSVAGDLRRARRPTRSRTCWTRWLSILPNPFTSADTDAGYTYNVSILQAEFSL